MIKKLSVILSNYNGSNYLSNSIKSILNQTYKDFDFYIIDDGSNDNSKEIIKKYSDMDSRIIFNFQNNLGLTKTLNKYLRQIESELVARIDSDDYSHPQRFEKQIEWFKRNPDGVLCGTRGYKKNKFFTKKIILKQNHDEIIDFLPYENSFIHSSVMFNLKKFSQIGLYDEYFKFAQDYDAWTKISKIGKVTNLSEYLCEIRSQSNSISKKYRFEQELYRIVSSIFNNFNINFNDQLKSLSPKDILIFFLEKNEINKKEIINYIKLQLFMKRKLFKNTELENFINFEYKYLEILTKYPVKFIRSFF